MNCLQHSPNLWHITLPGWFSFVSIPGMAIEAAKGTGSAFYRHHTIKVAATSDLVK